MHTRHLLTDADFERGLCGQVIVPPTHLGRNLITNVNCQRCITLATPLVEQRPEGDYYTGPLAPAQAYLRDEYGDDNIRVTRNVRGTDVVMVGEYRGCGDDPNAWPNQWGQSATGDGDEAWRYLLGADFGPVDEEYNEHILRDVLRRYEVQ